MYRGHPDIFDGPCTRSHNTASLLDKSRSTTVAVVITAVLAGDVRDSDNFNQEGGT